MPSRRYPASRDLWPFEREPDPSAHEASANGARRLDLNPVREPARDLPRTRDRLGVDVERLDVERERAGAHDRAAVAVQGEVVSPTDRDRVVGAVAGGEHEEERDEQEASHGRTARAGWRDVGATAPPHRTGGVATERGEPESQSATNTGRRSNVPWGSGPPTVYRLHTPAPDSVHTPALQEETRVGSCPQFDGEAVVVRRRPARTGGLEAARLADRDVPIQLIRPPDGGAPSDEAVGVERARRGHRPAPADEREAVGRVGRVRCRVAAGCGELEEEREDQEASHGRGGLKGAGWRGPTLRPPRPQ